MMTNNQQLLPNSGMDHRLLKAIVEGNKDLVEYLLNDERAVASLTGEEATHFTASDHVAISINDDETTSSCVVSCVTQRSKLLQEVTHDGDGVLHVAARLGHCELVRFIFQREEALVAELVVVAKNKRGDTPLHCAATSSGQMVSLLLSMAKKDPTEHFAKFLRARNQNGETCLHEAVRCSSTVIVVLLITVDEKLEEGEGNPALVKIVDNEGVSPLYMATTLYRIGVVRILTPTSSKHSASYAGPTGKTALHVAVCCGKR